MAIYHLNIKIISRSKGSSAIASSAYRSGSKLTDYEIGKVCDYSKKSGIAFSEVLLCKNAPPAYANRETLWNEVHKIEKSSNSQLAREIEVALPIELTQEQQIEVVRNFIQEQFISCGMCADWSLHNKNDGNPHAHIMLTTRPIQDNGKWGLKEKKGYALDENGERIPLIDQTTGLQKVDKHNRKQWKRAYIQTNDWNSKDKAEQWRSAWANHCNRYLDEANHIDHRSYKRQGLSQVPTIHEGYVARKMERQGKISDRCQINRNITAHNHQLQEVASQLSSVEKELSKTQHLMDLVSAKDEYCRQFILLSLMNNIPPILNPSAVDLSNKINQAFKQLKEQSTTLINLKKDLSNCPKWKLWQYDQRKQLQEKYNKTLKTCKKALAILKDNGVNTQNINNLEHITKSELKTIHNQVNKTLQELNEQISIEKRQQSIREMAQGITEHTVQNAFNTFMELCNTTLDNEKINAGNLLKDTYIPKDINYPIKIEDLISLEKTLNSIIEQFGVSTKDIPTHSVSKEHSTSRFSVKDLNNPKYAPRSTKNPDIDTNKHHNTALD